MRSAIVFALLMSFSTGIIIAQISSSNVEIGDVFIIGDVDDSNYKHIDFPRANFIIKRGGIVNYNRIKGAKVEVASIKKKKDGRLVATIKLTSNKYFFKSHRYVPVDIIEAISNKELLRI